MENYLFANDLIRWVNSSGESYTERVLWIDINYCIAYLIDVDRENALPELKKISEILETIELSQAIKINQDLWGKNISEDDLPDSHKQIRENAWRIISDAVIQEPDIYQRNGRGKLITQILLKCDDSNTEQKLTKKIIYKYLRKYWQRGKTKNSLLPDYQNCGNAGKVREAGDKKRGRPRKYAHDPDIGLGVNITEEDKRIFRISINQFYHTSKRRNFKASYLKMIQEYYLEDRLEYIDDIHGSLTLRLERPTIAQFRYWYQQEYGQDVKTAIISRTGRKNYETNERAVLGNSTMESDRPGARFQIDATVADVYLVSRDKRNEIIGRPVVYVVIDVFSRMIVGIYVGLEGPSWLGAMMALDNTMSNKVDFCSEYRIEINENQWPCHHLPETILGDRGEMLSPKVDPLINNLNVKVENTPAFRPDWKGIVERNFRIINEKVKPLVPGAIDIDFRQRGGHDYRLDAKLDLTQFTRIIINLLLERNNNHYLDNHPMDSDMIASDIIPIPIKIWNWGITNRSGSLRLMDRDIVRLNLMPRDKALITGQGIKFKGMFYTCDRAEKEGWFDRASVKKLSQQDKYLNIAYDPRLTDYLYIPSSDGRSFIKCELLSTQSKYRGHTLEESEYLNAYYRWQKKKHENIEETVIINVTAENEAIVEEAESMTNAAKDRTLSNRQRTRKIREHRGDEKIKQRETESFELQNSDGALSLSEDNNLREEPTIETSQPIVKTYQDRNLELLKKNKQEGKRGRGK